MLRVGLTGGIGSGKTTVARVFETLGIPLYYADDAARRLMNEDESLKQQLIGVFGEEIYSGGRLDRSRLGDLVFRDPEKLARLNSIVHPLTLQDADRWMKAQTTAYAVKEAALIFEAGLEVYFDYIIGVTAPEPLRIERAMGRDHISRSKVMERVASQMPEAEKIKRCHFVICNDENQAVIPQVLQIHEALLKTAAAPTSASPGRH
jgi:dephospho-CoA kinase